MKKSILLTVFLVLGLAAAAADRDGVREAQAVIERTFGEFPRHVTMKMQPKTDADGCDWFEYGVKRGVLRIEGNSVTALCRGFYDYVVHNG